MTIRLASLFPAKSVVMIAILLTSLASNVSAVDHKTKVIKANITNIEPIYMSYTLKKVSQPCASRARGCWNVSYQKVAAKALKGYRVKLSYKNNTFTARMQKKPTKDYLNIRVKSDLLTMPSTIAINAAVVY